MHVRHDTVVLLFHSQKLYIERVQKSCLKIIIAEISNIYALLESRLERLSLRCENILYAICLETLNVQMLGKKRWGSCRPGSINVAYFLSVSKHIMLDCNRNRCQIER
jgi:hypothetical protein